MAAGLTGQGHFQDDFNHKYVKVISGRVCSIYPSKNRECECKQIVKGDKNH